MIITADNLSEVIFENHDAKLLIEDVVKNTEAVIYFYSGMEMRVSTAIKIWHKAQRAYSNGMVS